MRKNERLFDTFCDVYVYQKLGLYSENVVKKLQSFTCRNARPESGDVDYNLGPFIHAINPYKTNEANHPFVTKTHPSERMAFPFKKSKYMREREKKVYLRIVKVSTCDDKEAMISKKIKK